MTNNQIIENAKQELARAGRIQLTGRTFLATLMDGSQIELPETEEIHTFSAWRSLGYSVRKGEHAVAQLRIWKYAPGQDEVQLEDGSEHIVDTSRMFMKTAFFFSQSQVERRAG